jgi:transcriptional antiterminator RfaH
MPIAALEPFIYPQTLFQEDTDSATDTGRWWVLHTRPRTEKLLARKLLRRNLSFFLPLYSRTWRAQGRTLRSYLPLFTGYVFLRGDVETRLSAIKTNLVSNCLHVEEQRQIALELAAVYQMIASGAALTPEDRLGVGDWVEITKGPLAGMEGRIVSSKNKLRFCIEIKFLQRGVSVDIDRSMLRPATQPVDRLEARP